MSKRHVHPILEVWVVNYSLPSLALASKTPQNVYVQPVPPFASPVAPSLSCLALACPSRLWFPVHALSPFLSALAPLVLCDPCEKQLFITIQQQTVHNNWLNIRASVYWNRRSSSLAGPYRAGPSPTTPTIRLVISCLMHVHTNMADLPLHPQCNKTLVITAPGQKYSKCSIGLYLQYYVVIWKWDKT